jgi:CheY-like chemotaxis protein
MKSRFKPIQHKTNRLLVKLLKPVGFEVQEASNGIEALEIWDSYSPHLDLDGHENASYGWV